MALHKRIITLSIILFSTVCDGIAQSPLGIRQAIGMAREKNPLLKTQSFNASIAQADITTAKLRPNLSLNNQTLQLMKPSMFPDNTGYFHGKNMQVWWQLTKVFESPVLRKYRIDVAQQGLSLAEKNYSETERAVYLDVANNWIDAWYARVNLDLVTRAQVNIDSLVYINQLRLKNQVITSSDALRTQLLAEQYTLQTLSARQEYLNQLQQLKFALGTADSLSIDLSDEVTQTLFTEQLDSLLTFASSNRSDLQLAQGSVKLAASNISYQKALVRPSPELGAIYNPQNTVPYLGFYGTIEIPIFSRNQGEIQKSKLLQEQARQTVLLVEQQVKTEITTAYNSYQTQKRNVDKFKSIMEKSTQVLGSVKYAYLKGGTTIIDFLDAQRGWFDTQKMYYDALYNYRRSYMQLLYATGLINQLKP